MARGIIRRLRRASDRVRQEILLQAMDGGKYAGALSTEGWIGGYRQALRDVNAVLSGWEPNDPRTGSYWEKKDG